MKPLAAFFAISFIPFSSFAGGKSSSGTADKFDIKILVAAPAPGSQRADRADNECNGKYENDCGCISECGRLCSAPPVFCGAW